jgi:hypothetical protein
MAMQDEPLREPRRADRRNLTAPSLMRMSAPARLGLAALLTGAIWLVVAWAVQ